MQTLRAIVRWVFSITVYFFAALGAFALWTSLNDAERARTAYAEYVVASAAYEQAIVAYDEEMGRVITEFMTGALEETDRTCISVDDALLASVETVWKRLTDAERAARRAFRAEKDRTNSNGRLLREYHLKELLYASHMEKTRLLLEGHRYAHEHGEAKCIEWNETLMPIVPGQEL